MGFTGGVDCRAASSPYGRRKLAPVTQAAVILRAPVPLARNYRAAVGHPSQMRCGGGGVGEKLPALDAYTHRIEL